MNIPREQLNTVEDRRGAMCSYSLVTNVMRAITYTFTVQLLSAVACASTSPRLTGTPSADGPKMRFVILQFYLLCLLSLQSKDNEAHSVRVRVGLVTRPWFCSHDFGHLGLKTAFAVYVITAELATGQSFVDPTFINNILITQWCSCRIKSVRDNFCVQSNMSQTEYGTYFIHNIRPWLQNEQLSARCYVVRMVNANDNEWSIG